VEGTGQTGQGLGARDEQQLARQLLQIQIPISYLLHELALDFGDCRSTSWTFHSHDLVHQNLLNQEESKDFHQEHHFPET
jgi:hypothetical protein